MGINFFDFVYNVEMTRTKKWVVLVLGILISLFLGELALRVLTGVNFYSGNFINRRFDWSHKVMIGRHEPTVGQEPNPNQHYVSVFPVRAHPQELSRFFEVNHTPEGFRRTPNAWGQLLSGEATDILTLGDSFTYGSEVNDEETWPTHLQAILGRYVQNGGMTSFGLDQMVLSLEKRLTQISPKIVILSLTPLNVERTVYTKHLTRLKMQLVDKPYFILANGELILKNVPLKEPVWNQRFEWPRELLGRSLLADLVFRTVAFDYWFGKPPRKLSPDAYRTSFSPEEVSCELLKRVQGLSKQYHFTPVAVAQDFWQAHSGPYKSFTTTHRVLDCAKKLNWIVADMEPELKARYDESAELYRTLFFPTSHMTNQGNLLVAKTIAREIKSKLK